LNHCRLAVFKEQFCRCNASPIEANYIKLQGQIASLV